MSVGTSPHPLALLISDFGSLPRSRSLLIQARAPLRCLLRPVPAHVEIR